MPPKKKGKKKKGKKGKQVAFFTRPGGRFFCSERSFWPFYKDEAPPEEPSEYDRMSVEMLKEVDEYWVEFVLWGS